MNNELVPYKDLELHSSIIVVGENDNANNMENKTLITWDELSPSLKNKIQRFEEGYIPLNGDVIGQCNDNKLKYIQYRDIGGNIWIEDDANKKLYEIQCLLNAKQGLVMSADTLAVVMYEYRKEFDGILELVTNPNEDLTFENNSLRNEFYYTKTYVSGAINHNYPFYFEAKVKWYNSSNDDMRIEIYFGSKEKTNGCFLDLYWGYPNGTVIHSFNLTADVRIDTNHPTSGSILPYNNDNVSLKDITFGFGISGTEMKLFTKYGKNITRNVTVYGKMVNPFYITAWMSDPPYWDDILSVSVDYNFGKDPWIYPEYAALYGY